METSVNDFSGNFDRRSLIKRGAAMAGAGLLGSMVYDASDHEGMASGNVFNVRNFGATGKREDKSTVQVQEAVDACAKSGGGKVYVPPGDYTVGTIQLKDNVNLHLESGSTFYLSQDRTDFVIQGANTMIFAEDAVNISLTGQGRLDGLAGYEFTEMRGVDPEIAEEIEIARKAGIDMRRYYRTGMQTYMCILNNCTNVHLSDISIINSPLWNVRLNDCDRVFIRGVYIYSDLEKGVNADGIDICSSRNVTVSDSVIITADDSVVLKTPRRRGRETVNCVENIVVTNCVFSSSSTALMIGTETHADIRHVIFSNCVIRNSNKGFGINVQDGAIVSDIIFSNLTIETARRHWNWWGSAEMCKFVLSRRNESSRLGRIRDIVVDTVIARVRGTSLIKGPDIKMIENITMKNVQIFMTHEDAVDKRATHALHLENVNGLRIHDLSVRWDDDITEWGWQSALSMKNMSDFEIRSFSGRQGLKEGGYPAIALDNVTDGMISDSRATDGCNEFIQLKGLNSNELILRNNNTRKAKTEIIFDDKRLVKAVNKV